MDIVYVILVFAFLLATLDWWPVVRRSRTGNEHILCTERRARRRAARLSHRRVDPRRGSLMTNEAWFALALYLAVLLALAFPLSKYIARIAQSDAIGGWAGLVERAFYRAAGITESSDMSWPRYAVALLSFNALGVVVVYLIQRVQFWLPLNPQHMVNVSADSAFNSAVSFVTNTDWQGYAGESTMSYFTQMTAFTVQNFLSAATGISVAFALIRGFARRSAQGIGNFWVDVTRTTLYVLLPLSVVFAVLFMSQGVIQDFSAYREVKTLESLSYENPKLDSAGLALKDAAGNAITEPATSQSQILPMGPVASQEAIKMIGTNGGGFFNANSAHPFENPTPLSDFAQMIAIFLIPASLCFVFGRMIGDTRQGWAVLGAMTVIFVCMAVFAIWAEQQGNPAFAALDVDQPTRHFKQAATWRVRNCDSASSRRHCSRPSRPPHLVAQLTPCMTHSLHWAVWSRCGSSNWGKSSSAARDRDSTACWFSRSWRFSSLV